MSKFSSVRLLARENLTLRLPFCNLSLMSHCMLLQLLYDCAEHRNLKQFLQGCGPLVTKEVVSMGLQALHALAYLHAARILHNDIATRNCVVDAALQVPIQSHLQCCGRSAAGTNTITATVLWTQRCRYQYHHSNSVVDAALQVPIPSQQLCCGRSTAGTNTITATVLWMQRCRYQ